MDCRSINAAGLLFYVTVRGGGGWGAVGLCVGDGGRVIERVGVGMGYEI